MAFLWFEDRALGKASVFVTAAAARVADALYEADPPPSEKECLKTFDARAGFGKAGPRVWLWWTAPAGAAGPTPGDSVTAWM